MLQITLDVLQLVITFNCPVDSLSGLVTLDHQRVVGLTISRILLVIKKPFTLLTFFQTAYAANSEFWAWLIDRYQAWQAEVSRY